MKLNYFNFKLLKDKYLLTNDFGNYCFVEKDELKKIVSKDVDLDSDLGRKLLSTNMVYTDTDLEYSSKFRYNLREIKDHLNLATSLHIFVVTTACNMRCVYCQANNGKSVPKKYMTKEIAEKAVDIALQSPNKFLSFEFQGGEPLLNFEVIQHIYEYTELNKGWHVIQYNIVTNLTLLTDEILNFIFEKGISVSTSLDGPEKLHNINRPFKNNDGTFKTVLESIKKLRNKGIRVGAIQTTTKESLKYAKEIVRCYAELGFDTIFIRPLTPLGKATVNWEEIGYSPEEFLNFYIEALDELINMNIQGKVIIENHAAIFLQRIQGQSVNYMELRSPCGAGIGQLAYYPDGAIFTCDEGRMLYEMGQDTFCLGHTDFSTFSDLINNDVCKTVCATSILETIPTCCDCVYQPYCGVCPVVNYAKEGDLLEKNPRGYRCKIYRGILDYLFCLFLKDDEQVKQVLNVWSN